MRLTHFALALTLVLLAITGYLAWEGQQEARGARKELAFVRSQQAAQVAATTTAPQTPVPKAVTPAPAETPPAPPETLPLPGATLTRPPMPTAAQLAALNEPTPVQKKIQAAPAIARVKSVVKDQGFVVIDAGSKQQIAKGMRLAVRRGNALLANITVADTVEENEAVADIDLASIPPGVAIEAGDEVIQPLGQ